MSVVLCNVGPLFPAEKQSVVWALKLSVWCTVRVQTSARARGGN